MSFSGFRILQYAALISVFTAVSGAGYAWYRSEAAVTIGKVSGGLAKVGASQGASIQDGLIGFWSFNGADISSTTAYDRSGQGNDGTLMNGPVPAIGRTGQALSFDGADDYARIPDAAALDFGYDEDFSLAFWIKAPVAQTDTAYSDNAIVEKWAWSGPYPYVFRIYNQTNGNSGKIQFARYDGSNNPSVISSVTVNDDVWHYIAGVKSGSAMTLYIDGIPRGSATDTTTGSMANASHLYFGARGGVTNRFRGSLDEWRIYGRALSGEEVMSLYQLGASDKANSSGSDPVSEGMSGFWSFNGADISSTTAYDRSGQGNDGTLMNGPVPAIGRTGQALSFDGADDYVFTPLDLPISPMSLSVWVKSNNVASADGRRAIMDTRDVLGQWVLYQSTANWKVTFIGWDSVPLPTKGVTSVTALSAGRWYHVVFTYDGTTAKLYIDGALESSTSSGAPLRDTGDHIRIGQEGGYPNRYWNGSLDEVRAYARVLSAAEVAALYKAGR